MLPYSMLDLFSDTLESVNEVVLIPLVVVLLVVKKWVQKRKRSLKVRTLQPDLFGK